MWLIEKLARVLITQHQRHRKRTFLRDTKTALGNDENPNCRKLKLMPTFCLTARVIRKGGFSLHFRKVYRLLVNLEKLVGSSIRVRDLSAQVRKNWMHK